MNRNNLLIMKVCIFPMYIKLLYNQSQMVFKAKITTSVSKKYIYWLRILEIKNSNISLKYAWFIVGKPPP